MKTISLKAHQLYDAKALLLGYRIFGKDKEGKDVDHVVIPGFVNERQLSEGVKRQAYKIGKILDDEIELVNKQRKDIADYTEEGAVDIDSIRKEKEQQLLNDEVKIVFEPISFSKIEHLSLSDNYQFLYDKFFE